MQSPGQMLAIAVFLHGLAAFAEAQDRGENQLVKEIRLSQGSPTVWWTGHNGWLVQGDGVLLGTDLVLDAPGRQHPSPVSAEELAPLLDISIVTHAHGDHFNEPTSRVLAEKSNCLFVLPRSCLEKAESLGIPRKRIVVATPRQQITVKGIKIEALRAIHGNRRGAVYWEANLDDCGYVLHVGNRTFMQPGDSVLLEDHLFLKHVDVLFFSPTEHNMQVDNSVTLINALEPDYILPQHRDTYPVKQDNRFWTYGYAYEVRNRLSRDQQARYTVVEMGGRVDISR